MSETIRILGIDPGSSATGWGVIDCQGNKLAFVGAGVVRPPRGKATAQKLNVIFDGLRTVVDRYGPHEAAVEETFVNSSPRDALVLGQARGIALLAPASCGLAVAEYAPNKVKKSVVGQGHADKAQVQAMIRVLLPAAGPQPVDAADALALAICHAHHRSVAVLADKHRRSA